MYYIVSEKNRWKKGELRETREREGEKGERERGRGKKVVVVQPRFRSVLLRKGISTAENRREKRQKKKKNTTNTTFLRCFQRRIPRIMECQVAYDNKKQKEK